MTDLLLDTQLTPDQRDYAGLVRSSASSLLTVINEILDFSKVEAGKLELEPIEFELRDSVDMAIKILAPRAQEKGLTLTCEIRQEAPVRVIGDLSRLRQIITNLVGNAIKFTERGQVSFQAGVDSIDRRNVTLHFTVRDTGIGIPQDKLQTIFEPFSQADGSTARKFGGTGLGLTISARLAEMMGGRIWAWWSWRARPMVLPRESACCWLKTMPSIRSWRSACSRSMGIWSRLLLTASKRLLRSYAKNSMSC